MPDREKVIKGLECCIRHGENAEVGCGRKDECPYERNGLRCWLDLNRDALAMLKEQEPMEPITDKLRNYVCPVCGDRLRGGKFCMNCGQAVKWE